MRKLILLCTSLCAMVLLISTSPVRAQSVLWVSPGGSDANSCLQTSPCATFQGAINKGSVSQINCLGSGSYGAFTVTASITVDCGTGNVGQILLTPFDTSGVTIGSVSPVTVVLRHLSINGGGTTNTSFRGINASNFGSGTLIVEDCMIQGFHGSYGIYFVPTNGRGLLQVSNSLSFGNQYGIAVTPASNQIASVMLSRVELLGNSASGLALAGAGIVAGAMRDSVVAENGQSGVIATASQVYFTIEESSLIANLTAGVATNSAGAVVNVGSSTIGANAFGVIAQTGSLISFGNNQMSANGSNGNFTSTTVLR